jgi:hypothetical protein
MMMLRLSGLILMVVSALGWREDPGAQSIPEGMRARQGRLLSTICPSLEGVRPAKTILLYHDAKARSRGRA